PLIARDTRVANDVTVGPPGTFLLVTGSNMSGKSTLLRAIGVNAVLAQAGAPVCAATFRLPPVAIHTSMRVQDSLERGVSHFMAELERLKEIVSAARAAGTGERTVLYLLDEILQGTNTAERQIAARRVIDYLLSTGAIGAVTTHDLTLTDTPGLSRASHAVHFTETVREDDGRPVMTFDYVLRPGIATSVNALRLMRIIGLEGRSSLPSATPPP
ncbi:MAG: MutS-related protein, partial [Gemmatimonadaceae bacterium]